jgi:hypothetical protein
MYFHRHEPDEPPHIHVDRDDQLAKFWLEPVARAVIWVSPGRNSGAFSGKWQTIACCLLGLTPGGETVHTGRDLS